MELSDQLSMNIKTYDKMRDELEGKYVGQFAIFSEGTFQGVYESRSDARKIGYEKFGRGKFSLKQLGVKPSSQGIETLNTNAVLKKDDE